MLQHLRLLFIAPKLVFSNLVLCEFTTTHGHKAVYSNLQCCQSVLLVPFDAEIRQLLFGYL